MLRKRGISTLLACQNEESLIASSIISFLPFSDEIIVADNGSSDKTVEIAQEVARAFPEKVKFFDLANVEHLHDNRQFAFAQSKFSWIVRADGDYICHTDGPYDARFLRNYLLGLNVPPIPIELCLEQPTLVPDFTRCFTDEVLRISKWRMPRIYNWFPGMRFGRLGRWEGVLVPKRWPKRMRYRIYWPNPIWMHCDVKSVRSYFYRSFRADWRESGANYPLEHFVRETIKARRSSITELVDDDMAFEAEQYFQSEIVGRSTLFDLSEIYYPKILRVLMDMDAGYKSDVSQAQYERSYLGPPNTAELILQCRPLIESAPSPQMPLVYIKGA